MVLWIRLKPNPAGAEGRRVGTMLWALSACPGERISALITGREGEAEVSADGTSLATLAVTLTKGRILCYREEPGRGVGLLTIVRNPSDAAGAREGDCKAGRQSAAVGHPYGGRPSGRVGQPRAGSSG